MSIPVFRRLKSRPVSIADHVVAPGSASLGEREVEASALALGIRVPSARPPVSTRPHRGQLPDVDFSRVVVVERPPLPWRIARWWRHHVRSRSREERLLAKPAPET